MKKILVLGLGLLVLPLSAHAGLNTLNGQTGTTQTFANDTNITISSSGNVHTLGWTGILQPSRGGTGTSTVMTQGSILFAGASGAYSQDNSNLFWDNTNNILSVANGLSFFNDISGASTISLGVPGATPVSGKIITPDGTNSGSNHNGASLEINIGDGNITNGGDGGHLELHAGSGFGSGIGGTTNIAGGQGDSGGGPVNIFGGQVTSTDGNGGTIWLRSGEPGGVSGTAGNIIFTLAHGNHTQGVFKFIPGVDPFGNVSGIFNFDPLTTNQIYSFQDASGTLSLLESDQVFSGVNTFSNPVNNFISSTDSTVHIGADGFPGCIVMGDSDSSGVTYVTADNGVLSATTTPPANCN